MLLFAFFLLLLLLEIWIISVFQKLSTSQDSSTPVQNEGTTKDPLSSALPDSLDEINQLRSASGEHSSITGSAPDSMQVGQLPILPMFLIKKFLICKVFSIVILDVSSWQCTGSPLCNGGKMTWFKGYCKLELWQGRKTFGRYIIYSC